MSPCHLRLCSARGGRGIQHGSCGGAWESDIRQVLAWLTSTAAETVVGDTSAEAADGHGHSHSHSHRDRQYRLYIDGVSRKVLIGRNPGRPRSRCPEPAPCVTGLGETAAVADYHYRARLDHHFP